MKKLLKLATPAIVFTAVLSGGGYISGREVYEYFFQTDLNPYLCSVIVSVGFFILSFFAIEISRIYKVYDYGTWSFKFLNKYNYLLDIGVAILSIIAIAVVISAAISTFSVSLGINGLTSATSLFIITLFILFLGEHFIIRFKYLGVISIYVVFITIVIFLYTKPHININSNSIIHSKSGFISSLKYIGYNTIVIPATLFAFKDINSKKESMISSILIAVISIIPIILSIFILNNYNSNLAAVKVPILFFQTSGKNLLIISLYNIVLLITLLDTSVGLIHSINERARIPLNDLVHSINKRAKTPLIVADKYKSAVFSLTILIISYLFASFGIIDLVSKGYGTMSIVFTLILIIPLLIKGLMIFKI